MASSSTASSQISTKDIERAIDALKDQRHRSSTRQNYYTIWKIFNKFVIRLDRKPTSWDHMLTLFVGHLIDSGKCSTTVKSYVSAIRAVLQNIGVKLNLDEFLIVSLTQACRLKNDRVSTRLPIQKGLLSIILKQVKSDFHEVGQVYLATLYQALFSTAYFGLFRVGELTTGTHPVLARNMHIGSNKRKMLLLLQTSKTHGKGNKP